MGDRALLGTSQKKCTVKLKKYNIIVIQNFILIGKVVIGNRITIYI